MNPGQAKTQGKLVLILSSLRDITKSENFKANICIPYSCVHHQFLNHMCCFHDIVHTLVVYITSF